MSFRFTVHYQEAEDGVTAQIVQVPAAISCGATREEALANVKEALALVLEAEAEDAAQKGDDILELQLISE